ncbi:hypothetical protein MCEGE14_00275 [Burkholderiaceae bacterium]
MKYLFFNYFISGSIRKTDVKVPKDGLFQSSD